MVKDNILVPLVDVAMGTYNHEKYIAQALDSVFMQKTTFLYRIIICDDLSTDNTRSIIMSYVKKYQGRIITVFPDKHFGLNHKDRPYPKVLKQCTAKYIAMLEGDDYWTDPLKLQKQVDFLEAHPESVACFHNVNVQYEDPAKKGHSFHSRKMKSFYTLEDIVLGFFIPTCSVMFRRGLFSNFPDWYYTMPIGDWPLHILNAEHGNFGYLNEILCTYRVHKGGTWSERDRVDVLEKTIYAAKIINEHLKFKFNKGIKRNIALWHYEIASNLSWRGNRQEALCHLTKYIALCPYAKISVINTLKILIRNIFPTLYKLLTTLRNRLDGDVHKISHS
jgi:glycosyltransferase involved in cell wall biosynthesis